MSTKVKVPFYEDSKDYGWVEHHLTDEERKERVEAYLEEARKKYKPTGNQLIDALNNPDSKGDPGGD